MDKTFHMVGGEEEASYAKNSSHQRLVLNEVKPLLMKCIAELLGDMDRLPSCIRVADLGCSSGPNLFLTAENIIESIGKVSQMIRKHEQDPPSTIQIQYFLNDLVSNDFNLAFKGLPEFCKKLERESDRRKFRPTCLIAAMPGSFYGKLFPDRSMHFQHSSYCLHWLSQVPSELATQSNARTNGGSIYCGKTSPPEVHRACLDQFCRDFTEFLRFRSQEMVQNGQLFITFLCKHEEDLEVDGYIFLFFLGMALTEMVTEGKIAEEKMESFNLPFYAPSIDETKQIVEKEGSFKIQSIHTFKNRLDESYEEDGDDDAENRARYVAKFMRAIYEPMLASHFGNDLFMDNLFERYANKLVNTLQLGQALVNNLVISLRKE